MAASKSGRASYTADQKAEALRLYEEQGTSAASEATGIPKSTIQSWARSSGLHTVRTAKTAAATEAASADAAKTRALVVSQSIALTSKLLNRVNAAVDVEQEMPAKDLAVIFGIVADKHKLLAGMDKTDESYSAVDAWLNHITGG
jgi:transposase-like protein